MPKFSAVPRHALNFHVQMYIIADKYGLVALKCLARQKLDSKLGAMAFTKDNIAAFLEALKLIYGTVLIERDDKIRDLFAIMLKQHQVALKEDDGFMALIGSGLGDGLFDRDVVKALVHR